MGEFWLFDCVVYVVVDDLVKVVLVCVVVV